LKKKGKGGKNSKDVNVTDNDVTRISFENDNEETKIDIEGKDSKSSSDKKKKKQ
jgi:hypothetical protein